MRGSRLLLRVSARSLDVRPGLRDGTEPKMLAGRGDGVKNKSKRRERKDLWRGGCSP
jgi:hypothetical protein